MIEGVHFRREWGGYKSVGWRLVVRCVSDVCGMGGRPTQLYLAVALGPDYQHEDLRNFYSGLWRALDRFEVSLCGGDTSESPGPTFYAGFCVGKATRPVYRATSAPGDTLWVTGPLGASYAGWLCLKDGYSGFPALVKRHLFPTARVDLASSLARFASSMIDISDGLSSDLARLREESGNGFRVDGWKVQIPGSVRKLAAKYHQSPLDWALKSGEEYELLFTVGQDQLKAFRDFLSRRHLTQVYCIGEVLGKGDNLILMRTADGNPEPLEETGWEHRIGA